MSPFQPRSRPRPSMWPGPLSTCLLCCGSHLPASTLSALLTSATSSTSSSSLSLTLTLCHLISRLVLHLSRPTNEPPALPACIRPPSFSLPPAHHTRPLGHCYSPPPSLTTAHPCIAFVHAHAHTPSRCTTRPPLWRPSRPPSLLLLLSRLTTTSLRPPMATCQQPPSRLPRILISSPWACLSLVCPPCVCVCLALSLPPVFRVSA